jgi:hypothetical protein
MGRSLEVKRKSENLPAIGNVFLVFSRFGTYCGFASQRSVLGFRAWLEAYASLRFCGRLQTVVPFAGTTVFFIAFSVPSHEGPVKKKGGNLSFGYVVLERT